MYIECELVTIHHDNGDRGCVITRPGRASWGQVGPGAMMTPLTGEGAAASVRSWMRKGQRGHADKTLRETLRKLEETEHAAFLLIQEMKPQEYK